MGSSGGVRSLVTVRKPTDQAFSVLALANDTHLLTPIGANQTLYFTFTLFQKAAATTTGPKFEVTGPAGSTVKWAAYYARTVAAVGNLRSGDVGDVSLSTLSGGLVLIRGICVAGGTAGNVQLQVASEVDTSAVTIEANSYLEVHA